MVWAYAGRKGEEGRQLVVIGSGELGGCRVVGQGAKGGVGRTRVQDFFFFFQGIILCPKATSKVAT